MTTVASTYASYERSVPPSSINSGISDSPIRSGQNRDFFTTDMNSVASRVGQSIDDTDILTLQRRYANMSLFEQNTFSNSAQDFSEFERHPYPIQLYDPDPNDFDDDDLPFDESNAYDYTIAIQERLKRANEELQHDQTSTESKHAQRVSFDAVVKAVDIVQDPNEHETINSIVRQRISPVAEESTVVTNSDNNTHEYTVPLNDTQPRPGLTLLEQIKALQFHGIIPVDERWATTANNTNNDSLSNRDDEVSVTSFKSNENNLDSQDISNVTSNSASSKRSMVVSVNGRIEMQDEDDYTVKPQLPSTESSATPITKTNTFFLPTPPTEPKQKQESAHRSFLVRPKSSPDKKSQITSIDQQRPESAGVAKSVERHIEKPSSGVDFDALLRRGAAKKRAELKEERRKQAEADAKREKELANAKESYDRWLQEKDSERKRINEEKRLEQEEKNIRQAEQERELAQLRERKYKEWLERKEQQAMLADEFKKLEAYEEAMTSGGSLSSINSNRKNNHRAFQRWLRQKYEKSLEEKRQARFDAKYIRRQHRRSLKRHQLHQDLQLARSYGYS